MAWRRKTVPPPARDAAGLVEWAKSALQRYWATRGNEGAGEVADACRQLTLDELRMLEGWVPYPDPRTTTGAKCGTARRIVAGVIAEKS